MDFQWGTSRREKHKQEKERGQGLPKQERERQEIRVWEGKVIYDIGGELATKQDSPLKRKWVLKFKKRPRTRS